MADHPLGLDDYPYRSGVLYASARSTASAMRRAVASIERGNQALAAETLRHALDQIDARLAEIDVADQARTGRLAAKRRAQTAHVVARAFAGDPARLLDPKTIRRIE